MSTTEHASGDRPSACPRFPWEKQAAEVADAALSGRKILAPSLEHAATDEEFAAGPRSFRSDPAAYYLDERGLNSLGYRLLRGGHVDRAIEVFLINTEHFPRSANVFDSLGDGYRAKGDTAQAIASYGKVLEIDPNFAASRQSLAELTGGR